MYWVDRNLNPARTEFSISGTPTMNVTQTTVYNYQIETVGSDCLPEIVERKYYSRT